MREPEEEVKEGNSTQFLKAGSKKKKKGSHRVTLTLGGKKKVEKALRRKMKSKMRKRMGEMNIPEGRRGGRRSGPLAPIKSVLFIDNTMGGELAQRL